MIKLKCTRIRFLISSKGLKNTWIAKEVGISRTYFELLIHERRNPSEAIFKKIAKILNVSQKMIGVKDEKAFKDSTISLNRNRISPSPRRRSAG